MKQAYLMKDFCSQREDLSNGHTDSRHGEGKNEWSKRKKTVPYLTVTPYQYGESYGHIEYSSVDKLKLW